VTRARVALVNPSWSFEGSVYFGCREPHLPLEYGYAKALLEAEGHDVLIVDGQLGGEALAGPGGIARAVAAFGPDLCVVTSAPSYLFWRCAPPELRVPREAAAALRGSCGALVGVGPHASTTPRAALAKLSADAVVLGECEEILVRLAGTPRARWGEVDSIAWRDGRGPARVQGGPHATDMARLPALAWPDDVVRRHAHHHHRFDGELRGLGAEVEASRGCPYHCTFCAKESFRDGYRKRPLAVVLEEIDRLAAQGVEYVYFIDEIFVPDRPLLEALRSRPIRFGVQMRIDNWSAEMLDLLGDAGCVSIEAGVESVTEEGRSLLAKRCKLTTRELVDRLVRVKRRVAFVQANLMDSRCDRREDVDAFRAELRAHGVWANDPVPLFPYPGSPEYALLWGPPDDLAWERAHEHYLARFDAFSDVQEVRERGGRPRALAELEARGAEVAGG